MIKKLKWHEGFPGTYTELAQAPWGTFYMVWEIDGRGYWSDNGKYPGHYVNSIESGIVAARQACQDHFETIVKEALIND